MSSAAEPVGLLRSYRDTRWGRLALVWGAIFVLDASRTVVDSLLAHRGLPVPYLIGSALSMVLWAFYTPFIFWVARRAPFERGQRLRDVAAHAGAYLLLTTVDSTVQTGLFTRLLGERAAPFAAMFMGILLVDGFSYATVVAIATARRIQALYRERVAAQAALDRELARARLRALEMQLQPHFLFNTLHTVGSLVRAERHDDAVKSLATLGDLLRAALADDGPHEIALADELDFARGYLSLQQLRFGDRLDVAVDVPASVEGARVPRLILQPLLENAIRHGVERSRTAVHLDVRARAAGDRLELVVADRGGQRGAPTPGQGIGLRNTRARLDALYGAAHRFDTTPTESGGLEVRIEVPLASARAEVVS